MNNKKKNGKTIPIGIRTISIIFVILFGIMPLFSVLSLQKEETKQRLIEQLRLSIEIQNTSFDKLIGIMSLVTIFVSIFFIMAGIGISKRKEVARKITVRSLFGFLCLFVVLSISQPGMIINYLFYILSFSGIIYYLTDKNVKNQFN